MLSYNAAENSNNCIVTWKGSLTPNVLISIARLPVQVPALPTFREVKVEKISFHFGAEVWRSG